MYLFDKDIAVTRQSSGLFLSDISANWSVDKNPDGGYLMAILANAVQKSSDKKWPLIVTANFISRCAPGPAEITLEHMGSSRYFDRWQVTLSQEGAPRIRTLCTMTDETDSPGEKRYEVVAPDLPDRKQCVEMPNFPGYTMFDHLEIRLDPACVGWMTTGDLTETSEHTGWMGFRDGRPFDALAALLATDAFPPPILSSQGAVAWVPTIEMSVNVRNNPQTSWLKCAFRSRFLSHGVVEEDGRIWDENNELIAISRQVSLFRKTV